MAERLTEFVTKNCSKPFYRFNENSHISIRYRYCNNIDKAINKLGRLEDIMAKYGIESVEELDKIFGWLYTLSGEDIELMKFIAQERKQIHDMYCEIKKDRDTWQKACELACKRICYMLDQEMQYHEHEKFNSEEYLKTEIDYFYQQAKTEGNDEK